MGFARGAICIKYEDIYSTKIALSLISAWSLWSSSLIPPQGWAEVAGCSIASQLQASGIHRLRGKLTFNALKGLRLCIQMLIWFLSHLASHLPPQNVTAWIGLCLEDLISMLHSLLNYKGIFNLNVDTVVCGCCQSLRLLVSEHSEITEWQGCKFGVI